MIFRKQGAPRCLRHAIRPAALTLYASVLWMVVWADAHLLFRFPPLAHTLCFGVFLAVPAAWAHYWRSRSPRIYRGVLSIGFLPLWQFAVVAPLIFSAYGLSEALSHTGVAISFFIGLCWAVWAVDRQTKKTSPSTSPRKNWNPFRRWAWYFGRDNPKLWQSTATLGSYCTLFSSSSCSSTA